MFLYPDRIFHRITDIRIEDLKDINIKALLIDVDNTLSTHGSQQPIDKIDEWIKSMKENNISLYILSNARKSRVEPFAKKVGLDFIHLGVKPLPIGYIRGKLKVKVPFKNIAIVGDQIFTDVLGGRLSGVKCLLVTPILLEEKTSFKIRRKLEKLVFKMHKKKDDNNVC